MGLLAINTMSLVILVRVVIGAVTFLIIFMPDGSIGANNTCLSLFNPMVWKVAGNTMSMSIKMRFKCWANTCEVFLINKESRRTFHTRVRVWVVECGGVASEAISFTIGMGKAGWAFAHFGLFVNNLTFMVADQAF